VAGPGVGTAPEAVRFLPVVGVEWEVLKGLSKIALRPIDIAADIKYEAFLFLTAFAISASWAVALRSIWSTFHSCHFSSTSMVASLAISFSDERLKSVYQFR